VTLAIRAAEPDDAPAMAAIFNQGIADRVATFETAEQTAAGVSELIGRSRLLLVAERGAEVVGWAKAGPYTDAHSYYDGVAEATLYVERGARRTGVGRALLEALVEAAPQVGLHKLVGKVFTSNHASIEMLRSCGWHEVGVHRRHGTLDGAWKDVLIVERLLHT
jgi:L-amino acid N-acyltransferase YncA